jgi:hypothetical protein
MNQKIRLVALFVIGLLAFGGAASAQLEIFGTWHCGDDYCTWGTVPDMVQFDIDNHWLIDRGDGTPAVNLVILAFVHPMKLLNQTTDADTLNGVQRGMTQDVVDYFKNEGIRVMVSMGGFTYVDFWTDALAQDAWQLGINAAQLATDLGVGFEIDYEENTDPDLVGLQTFIDAYRSVHPYDATGNDHTARLTIDTAAGDRYLIPINREATANWIPNQQIDYMNAMVTARPYKNSSAAIGWWQEHIDGKSNYNPVILPLAPAKFTGGLYLNKRNGGLANCDDYPNSIQFDTESFVQTAAPNGAGTTSGMLGFMFWSAGCPSTNAPCTTGSDSCEDGIGAAAIALNVPVPMPALRQQ